MACLGHRDVGTSTDGSTIPEKRIFWYTGRMEYLSVSEAAGELGLSVWGVRDRIERGDVRAERLGTSVWAIPRAEVERWKALGRKKPGRKPKRQQARSKEQDHGDGESGD